MKQKALNPLLLTKASAYFPVIVDRAVDWNFNDDSWDGEPIDQHKVVKEYIMVEVIKP